MRCAFAAVLLVAFASPASAAIFYDDPTGWVGDLGPVLGVYVAHRDFHFDTPVKVSIDYRSDLYSFYSDLIPGVWQSTSAATGFSSYNLDSGLVAALSVFDGLTAPTLEQVDRPADVTKNIVSTLSAVLPAGDYRVTATSSAQFFMSTGIGRADLTIGQVSIVPVPEPATFGLAAVSLAAVVVAASIRRLR